ncbi:unnamed protein product [Effrenium voratum]|nr:unnamed protein product [Effrenium voratum]
MRWQTRETEKDGSELPTEESSGSGRLYSWWRRLIGHKGSSGSFSRWHGSLDEPNQRVIRADCERTRADMEYFRQPLVRDKMEAMLTCWCRTQKERYKQGLNEVLALFLYLQAPEHPHAAACTDDEVFDLFTAFVKDYSPFFSSEEFVPLQCAFIFFRRLLLYHRPDLHNLFVEKGVTPDMFCMPWFLTLFASKTPMRLAMQLWDRHLERGEPHFFLFLAAAVVTSAEKEILQAERSALPEILTSLGMYSREDMEGMWSSAENLLMQTPATFVRRVRRIVLQPEVKGPEEGHKQLERLEKEGVFFILAEEVVGHCYPARPGEALKPWQPSASCPWRLLLLDLRPAADFEATRLPAAVHFDVAQLFPQSAWSGRKLLWGKESEPQPSQVLAALKATLGENWVCDSQAHLCLLGRSEESLLLRALYIVLTKDLSLRHVSVANGGFEAVMKCAQKHNYDIIESQPENGMLDRHPLPSSASVAAEGAAAAAAAAAEGAAQKLSSVLSSLKRVTAGAGVRLPGSQSPGSDEPRSSPGLGPPTLLARPGNWPADFDMSQLPRRNYQELMASQHWSCVALLVRRPSCPELQGSWQGCSCILSLLMGKVVCAAVLQEEAVVLAEFSVLQVAKVTTKKNLPQTAYCHIQDNAKQAEPALVLYFSHGAEQVSSFASALKDARQSKAARLRGYEQSRPLAPPAAAKEAVAVALAAEGCNERDAAEEPSERQEQEAEAVPAQVAEEPTEQQEQAVAEAVPAQTAEEPTEQQEQPVAEAVPAQFAEEPTEQQEQAVAEAVPCHSAEEQGANGAARASSGRSSANSNCGGANGAARASSGRSSASSNCGGANGAARASSGRSSASSNCGGAGKRARHRGCAGAIGAARARSGGRSRASSSCGGAFHKVKAVPAPIPCEELAASTTRQVPILIHGQRSAAALRRSAG